MTSHRIGGDALAVAATSIIVLLSAGDCRADPPVATGLTLSPDRRVTQPVLWDFDADWPGGMSPLLVDSGLAAPPAAIAGTVPLPVETGNGVRRWDMGGWSFDWVSRRHDWTGVQLKQPWFGAVRVQYRLADGFSVGGEMYRESRSVNTPVSGRGVDAAIWYNVNNAQELSLSIGTGMREQVGSGPATQFTYRVNF
jgi:hypothetical protein